MCCLCFELRPHALITVAAISVGLAFHDHCSLYARALSCSPRYANDKEFNPASGQGSIDWNMPWIVKKSSGATGLTAVDSLKSSLANFTDSFPQAASAKTSEQRAQSPWLPGLGQEQVMEALSLSAPPEDIAIDLKRAERTAVHMLRLTKVHYLFGYMSDCVYVDTEPYGFGQLRALHRGSAEVLVMKIQSLRAMATKLEDMRSLMLRVKTTEEARTFSEKIHLSTTHAEARSVFACLSQ